MFSESATSVKSKYRHVRWSPKLDTFRDDMRQGGAFSGSLLSLQVCSLRRTRQLLSASVRLARRGRHGGTQARKAGRLGLVLVALASTGWAKLRALAATT